MILQINQTFRQPSIHHRKFKIHLKVTKPPQFPEPQIRLNQCRLQFVEICYGFNLVTPLSGNVQTSRTSKLKNTQN
nr:hypothetical protein CFP56_64359 [Quercus suber]